MRAVYGPRDSGTIPVFSADGSKPLLDKKDVLNCWAEHFNNVLNQPSDFDDSVLDEIPQWDTAAHLADPPTIEEVARAISQMSSYKSPGADSVPAEIYKHGGENLTNHLHQLFTKIWNKRVSRKILRMPR